MTVAASAVPTTDSVAELRAALGLRVGAGLHGLDWVARLPSAAAPRFVYLAGACGGVPVGGGGFDLAEAAGRLAGETAEVMAQSMDPVPSELPGDPAIDALWTAAGSPLRVAGACAGRARGVPAAAIFRTGRAADERAAGAPPTGLGLAAGPDAAAARLAALLELIERDAAAAWWNGGAAPRQLPVPVPDPAPLRAGAGLPRVTAFLDLSSATGVPVVCALSRDPDGRGLALGLKAAPDPAAAARGALVELLQMEIALELARLRHSRGDATPGDAAMLARAALDPDALPAFSARLPAEPHSVPADFDGLVRHLAARGVDVTVADLPAPDLAVAKAFAPALRPLTGPGPARSDAPGALAALM